MSKLVLPLFLLLFLCSCKKEKAINIIKDIVLIGDANVCAHETSSVLITKTKIYDYLSVDLSPNIGKIVIIDSLINIEWNDDLDQNTIVKLNVKGGYNAKSDFSMGSLQFAVSGNNNAISANFSFWINESTREVHFVNVSDGPFDTWLWSFGDGSYSIEKAPVIYYTNDGFYDVKLTISNDCYESIVWMPVQIGSK